MGKKDDFRLPAKTLYDFARTLLFAGGFTQEESDITAHSLVDSDLAGYGSHGTVRVAEYIRSLEKGLLTSNVPLGTLKETPNTCVANGLLGLGQVQMPRMIDKLTDKAKNSGVATGTIQNCGHVGRLGEWVEYIAGKGYAGFVFVNDNGTYYCVAPPGGKKACTSTNPVAFGIPLPNGETFTIDVSTSTVAAGKIRLAYLSGQECPPGLLQDANGKPTTNPDDLFASPQGALLPMGGHKGFALSMIVDCLVSGLSGGFTPPAPEDAPQVNNVLINIWNPEHFSGLDHMQSQAEKYLDFLRQSPAIDPATPVRIPGDRAKAERKENNKTGIPLSSGSINALVKAAKRLNVDIPDIFEKQTGACT